VTGLVAISGAREKTIARLSDAFANDLLSVEEFERRVTLAHTSESVDEIEALAADLPADVESTATKPSAALVPVAEVQARGRVLSVLGSTKRAGAWTPAHELRVSTVLGNAELDFREARLSPGVIDLYVRSVLGNVEIVVPPGLAVETDGSAVLGNFEHVARAPAKPDPDAPLLRIHGAAVLGNVEVRMRLPGESEWASWRRNRREAREERKALRDGAMKKLPPHE
jgi:hypothetical protein